MTPRALRVITLAGLGVAMLAAAGCDVTPEKINRWKETERGPAKLKDAVENGSLAASLRGQALSALVEIGMSQDAVSSLEKSPDPGAVVREATPLLAQLALGNAATTATTRVQREAKDALFLLRAQAPDDAKQKIDDALIQWTCADLTGRMDQGGQSSEKILVAIGPRALPKLEELVRGEGANQLTAASLIGKIGDAQASARAADALVESAKKTAARTRDVPDGLLKAIGLIGGPHADAFLVDQAEHGSEIVRQRALLALSQGSQLSKDPLVLAAALRIAGDRAAPGKVREGAFQVLEKIGPAAVPGLVKIEADPDLTTAERAIEAALAAGKAEAVKPVLEALPAKLTKREDLDSFVVHDLGLIGPSALPSLKEVLKAKSPFAKVAAVRAVAQLGGAADAPAVEALAGDGTPLKNYGATATVGSEAKAAVATLKNKK